MMAIEKIAGSAGMAKTLRRIAQIRKDFFTTGSLSPAGLGVKEQYKYLDRVLHGRGKKQYTKARKHLERAIEGQSVREMLFPGRTMRKLRRSAKKD